MQAQNLPKKSSGVFVDVVDPYIKVEVSHDSTIACHHRPFTSHTSTDIRAISG